MALAQWTIRVAFARVRRRGGSLGPAALRCLAGLALVAIATVAGLLIKQAYAVNTPPALLLLLASLITALSFDLYAALAAGLCAAASLDFFFLDPVFAFGITRDEDVAAFIVFCLVSVATSRLATHARARVAAAEHRARSVVRLYDLCRILAASVSAVEAKNAVLRELGASLHAVVRVVPEPARLAGPGRDRSAGLMLPLAGGADAIEVTRLDRPFTRPEREFAAAVTGLFDLALGRVRLSEQMETARIAAARQSLASTLLDTVAHDLRAPLASIAAASESLRGASLDDESRDSLQVIDSEADRLNRLVANVLGMVRLEAGVIAPSQRMELADALNALAARSVRVLRGRELRIHTAPRLPFVSIEPAIFEQVMINLLDNAVKFSPPGSPVLISATQPASGTVSVTVRDHGPGIPADQLERVFDRFVRLDWAGCAARPGGFGMGLAICRGLLVATGGSMAAANADGGGLVVTVNLPTGEPVPEPSSRENALEIQA